MFDFVGEVTKVSESLEDVSDGCEVKSCPASVLAVQVVGLQLIPTRRTELVKTGHVMKL